MRNRSCFALGAGIAVAMWAMATALSPADAGSAPIGGNGTVFRSTELAGLDVYSRGNDNSKLGHLSDLLVDAHNGRVLYGILDTGIGGNYLAVPWNALGLQENTESRTSQLTLDKASDDLKNAPTFDKKNPPDYASSQWRAGVDRFFGLQTAAGPQDSGALSANELVFLSSKLEKLRVFNEANRDDKLGSLDNLIIDARTGQVMYGVLNTGLGGNYIPVPWAALKLFEEQNQNSWLTLNKTSDDLKNAPTIDMKHAPDFTGNQWARSVNDFFGVRMAAAARPVQ